jgi:O-antigen ligase
LILTFFQNKRYLYLPIIFLIPSLIFSDSNAPFLGILNGLFFCLIFFVAYKIRFLKRTFIFFLLGTFTLISFKNVNNLPTKFDMESITNFEFKIPTNLIDTHRQFIWGFSLNKFKDNSLLGYGPDTSNFIDDSQRIIGHKKTGDMKFIPSHPHNFFIEILLELGILGTFSFILFILFMNYQILIKANLREKFYLIFFNGYFWGSSLVNFSFWLGWWQGSYFFILSLIATKIFLKKKINY